MNFWMILLLFVYLLVNVIGRPQQADYNNDSDVDETDDNEAESAADMYSADDSGLNDQKSAAQEDAVPRNHRLMDLSENRYIQNGELNDNTARAKSDTLADARISQDRDDNDGSPELVDFNDQDKFYPNRRHFNKYMDTIDEQDSAQLASRDISKPNLIQNVNLMNKRTIGFGDSNEEGNIIFEKNKNRVNHNKIGYNANDVPDLEQQRNFKHYNTIQAENRDVDDSKTRDSARFNIRDRREVLNESENKESSDKQVNENEESAIKQHITKLSSDELDQLLNSLTVEKKELLKKIMEDTDCNTSAYIKKRDITKKAGAVAEEINYIENYQSDLNKLQGENPSLEMNSETALSQSSETTEINSSQQSDCQTENPDISQKTSVANVTSLINVELNTDSKSIQKKSGNSFTAFPLDKDNKNQISVVNNEQAISKTDAKREAKLEDSNEADTIDDNKMSQEDYVYNQGYLKDSEENLKNVIMEDEKEQCEGKSYKREIFDDKESELSDSFKSLEDSFPHSNAYDDSAPYTGPLVRVKRKNYDQVVHKRSLGLMPDAKVSYFLHKTGVEDEDNDEGNEFDDEGFYDRTSNFANSNGVISDSAQKSEKSNQLNDNPKSTNDCVDGDTMSLGSDTDSVLSGVEGVNDNLMYNSNSGTRNRRDPDDMSSEATKSKIDNSESLLEDNRKIVSGNYENIPYYQESDAFGAPSQNYAGDLNRYKRIRRVKDLQETE